jgi:hypothetical protein
MRLVMKRLSYGERDAGDRGQQYLRDLFLHHVSEVPGVIEGLKEPGLTLPLYYGRLHFRESKLAREFLEEWSKDWNLDAGWIRERAFEKLCFWAHEREEYRIYDLGVGSGSAVCSTPPEGLPTYYVGMMRRTQYLELVRSTVLLKLQHDPLLNRGDNKAYAESIVRGAKPYWKAAEAEYALAPIKLNLERDVTWTVRFQVENRECSEIVQQDLPGRKEAEGMVRKAIADVLKRIELRKRTVRRGRKKGSKNKYPLTDLGKNKNVREV